MTLSELVLLDGHKVKASELVDVLTETSYVTEKHECTDLDNYLPADCPPCIDCGHAECRHIVTAELFKTSPCEVTGCDCGRMACGDECEFCKGDGHTEDPRTGLTYDCPKCFGNGVIS